MSLTIQQLNAVFDERGRVRCPWCGKFRKLEDFPEQSTTKALPVPFTSPGERGSIAWITFGPSCTECLDRWEREDEEAAP